MRPGRWRGGSGGEFAGVACSTSRVATVLLAQALLLLDDTSPSAVVVDRVVPPSAATLSERLAATWPRLRGRVAYEVGDLGAISVSPDDLVVSCHACGALSDAVLTRAIDARAAVAVLPCCHDDGVSDAGVLAGWLTTPMAIDVMRAMRLQGASYTVWTQTIPEVITPQNRLLIGVPRATVVQLAASATPCHAPANARVATLTRMPRKYWLMKCEPSAYTIGNSPATRRRDGKAFRNYQARNFMRDEMQAGDGVLFYASNADPSGVTGLAEIVRRDTPIRSRSEGTRLLRPGQPEGRTHVVHGRYRLRGHVSGDRSARHAEVHQRPREHDGDAERQPTVRAAGDEGRIRHRLSPRPQGCLKTAARASCVRAVRQL